MRFTMSKDGVERATFRVEIRLERERVDDIRNYLRGYDGDSSDKALREFLTSCCEIGLEDYSDTLAEANDGRSDAE